MHKKIGIIIAIIGIIIILAVIIIINITDKTKSCQEINRELKNYILAIKTQDITYCGNTGNPKFCTAQILKDISFCETQEDKRYCLAIITENEQFCEPGDWWCKADASKNPDYCKNLPEHEREECGANIALNEKYYEQENLCYIKSL